MANYLPLDILREIGYQLSVSDILSLSETQHCWRILNQHGQLWNMLLDRDYPAHAVYLNKEGVSASYHELYTATGYPVQWELQQTKWCVVNLKRDNAIIDIRRNTAPVPSDCQSPIRAFKNASCWWDYMGKDLSVTDNPLERCWKNSTAYQDYFLGVNGIAYLRCGNEAHTPITFQEPIISMFTHNGYKFGVTNTSILTLDSRKIWYFLIKLPTPGKRATRITVLNVFHSPTALLYTVLHLTGPQLCEIIALVQTITPHPFVRGAKRLHSTRSIKLSPDRNHLLPGNMTVNGRGQIMAKYPITSYWIDDFLTINADGVLILNKHFGFLESTATGTTICKRPFTPTQPSSWF